jgi:hypothetical protein
MKTNSELATLIRDKRPDIPEIDILKAVTKLRKLSKTILSRTDPFIYAASGDVYTRNTLKFYAKANRVASSVGCAFLPYQPVLRGYPPLRLLVGDIEEPLV